jgi:predicted enzyme related to lactoylglutathione lyase
MSELAGVNHIALLTSDIDRLGAFYEQVFGAAKVVDCRYLSRKVPVATA